MDRLTGGVADVRHDASHSFDPVAAAHDGSYAVSAENCRETEHRLIVMVHGKPTPSPSRVVGTDPEPLDWSSNSRELLVQSAPGIRLLRLTDAGLVDEASLSSTPGRQCRLDAAVFDAFGVLEALGCPRHGAGREQLWQLRGTGPQVLWRASTPLDAVSIDTDVVGRTVVMTGACHGRCGEGPLTNAVLIGPLSRRGVTLRPVRIDRRFVDSATF